jgi:ABC-type branched-subunit amino acid transport system ATPase component
MSNEMILRIEGVTKRFGGLVAVNNVSFDVPKGQVFALIGPNGAGKTTLFNCITGLFQPTLGNLDFEGKQISGTRWPGWESPARFRTSVSSTT